MYPDQNNNPNQPTGNNPKDKKKLIIIVSVVAFVLAIIIGIVFLEISRRNFSTPKNSTSQISTNTSSNNDNQSQAEDSEVKSDINAIHSQLEAHYATNGFYPSQAEVNSLTWRTENLRGLDTSSLITPKGTEPILTNSASQSFYQYTPSGCDSFSKNCVAYELIALLNKDERYQKTSLN